jgi:preprotein translocase subunit SecA
MSNIMDKLGMEEGEPIEHNLISRAIENAQSKVEAQNFDIRKHLLEYDDVMNQQREVIYRHRREALTGKNLKGSVEDMIRQKAEDIAYSFASERIAAEEWDWKGLEEAVFKQFLFRFSKLDQDALDGLTADGLAQIIEDEAFELYKQKEDVFGEERLRQVERHVMLQTVDSLWKDHLLSMDHLKQGIGLRGYAQQNPLVVYKKEGYEMFQDLIDRIQEETVAILFRIQLVQGDSAESFRKPKKQQMFYSGGEESRKKKPVQRKDKKVGRNEPCPCGSGKKYKKCCGR